MVENKTKLNILDPNKSSFRDQQDLFAFQFEHMDTSYGPQVENSVNAFPPFLSLITQRLK